MKKKMGIGLGFILKICGFLGMKLKPKPKNQTQFFLDVNEMQGGYIFSTQKYTTNFQK